MSLHTLIRVPLQPSCRHPSGTGRLLSCLPGASSSTACTPQLFQAVLIRLVYAQRAGVHVPPLNSLQQMNVLVLGTPELQWGLTRAECRGTITLPCWLWFLWCCVGYRWLSGLQALVQAHIELLINQHLLVLLRASLMPSLYLHLGLLQPLQLLLGYRKAEQVVNSLGLGAPTAFSPGSAYGDMSQFLTLWVCSASAISSGMFSCF